MASYLGANDLLLSSVRNVPAKQTTKEMIRRGMVYARRKGEEESKVGSVEPVVVDIVVGIADVRGLGREGRPGDLECESRKWC
jgi:hypothetical protein